MLVERSGATGDELLTAICEKESGTSGVTEEQLDSELSAEDLIDGVGVRELEVVVFVERDREERLGVCGC